MTRPNPKWAMACGAVIGFLGALTIASIASAALGSDTAFDAYFSEMWFWLLILVGGPAGAFGGAAVSGLLHATGQVSLPTLVGATVGPVVGFALAFTWSTRIGAGLDALVLILWEWLMCGIGALLGSLVERFMNRGLVQTHH